MCGERCRKVGRSGGRGTRELSHSCSCPLSEIRSQVGVKERKDEILVGERGEGVSGGVASGSVIGWPGSTRATGD